MKHNILKTVLVTLLSVSFLSFSVAANAKNTTKSSSGLENQFSKADINKQGNITKKQAFRAKMFEVDRYFFDIDTNIDGYVSLDELKTWKKMPVRTAPRPRGDKLDRYVAGDSRR